MTKQVSLHLPDDLHARARKAADHDRRSLHSELLYVIEEWLAGRKDDASSPQAPE